MIEGLGRLSDVSLTLTAPAQLVDLLVDRKIDVGLVSLIDAQRAPEPLTLLPVGMIASDGPTMTVRLYSRIPFEEIREVMVDADSHTSVALMRVILARMFGARPVVSAIDVETARPDLDDGVQAILLIGDKVVTNAPPAERYPFQIDLGEQWRELTGLPFVYAVWMCRESDRDADWARTVCRVLDRQRRHNATRLDWIAAVRAPLRGWDAARAAAYLGASLEYDVGPRHREAVERFFDLCAQDGLIPQRRPTTWLDLAGAPEG